MSRRLLFLNLVLVALLGAAGWHMRQRYEEARLKERAFLGGRTASTADPQVPKVDPVQPVTATNYADVAAKMLFSKDRNPTVIIEPEVIKEDPVPPFPVAYGVLALGSAPPRVFMSEKPGAPQKGYRVDEPVGPFKLVAIEGEELTLEWKDKKFKKTLQDLKPAEAQAAAAADAQPAAPQAPVKMGHTTEEVTKPEVIAEAQKKMSGDNPWVNVGGANHACSPGDQTPAGTVVNGYRKVTKPSMFGTSCFWEPAR